MENLSGLVPQDVLMNFITAMYEWECACWNRLQIARQQDTNRTALHTTNLFEMKEIFAMYCTDMGGIGGRAGEFRNPPEYDPELEHIVRAEYKSNDDVIIYTNKSGPWQSKYRYHLLRCNNIWSIDHKEQYLFGQWDRVNL